MKFGELMVRANPSVAGRSQGTILFAPALVFLTIYADFMPVLLLLLAASVTLLLLRLMRQFEGVFQGDEICLPNESFRLTWRPLILLLGFTLSCLILPIRTSPLHILDSSMFTAIVTSAAATTTAATATAAERLPFLCLLFSIMRSLLFSIILLLMLWCFVRGSERLHDGQGLFFSSGNRSRLARRFPLLSLSFILSCSMLPTTPIISDIATIIASLVFTFVSFSLSLSSSPLPAPAPAEPAEAAAAEAIAAAGMLMDMV